jgi:prepilin-type N-terminal cleavage/methylation domain-containing protein
VIASAAIVRRYAPATLAAAVGVAVLAWLGLTGFAWTDYDDEASRAYLALAHGDVGGFLALLPAYGGSLVLRAPFALVPGTWGGGELAVFRAVSLPCMAAAALLGIWLTVRLRDLGVDRLARWSAFALLAAGPISLRALDIGHPEELLVATLCVVAVLAAASGRWVWAGVALGLAVGAKPWALLAVGPVLAALPIRRLRTLLVAGLAVVALLAPIAVGAHTNFRAASAGMATTGTIFQPWQVFWWAGAPSGKVRGFDGRVKVGYRAAPAWINRVSHPLIVLLAVPLTLLWVSRRRVPGVGGAAVRSAGLDGLRVQAARDVLVLPPGSLDDQLVRSLRSSDGFTLIEILMVIVICGILAAIALPAFLSQKDKATDAKAQVDARTAQTAMGVYRTDTGSYACGSSASCVTELRRIESTVPATGLGINGFDGTGDAASDAFRATAAGGEQRTFWAAEQPGQHARGCALNGAPRAGRCRVTAGAPTGSW